MPIEPTREPADTAGAEGPQASPAPAPLDRPTRRLASGEARLRQRPPAWTALLIGLFAVGVFAATDGVLRLLADPSPQSAPVGAGPAGTRPAASPPSATTPPAPTAGAGDAPPAAEPVTPGAANDPAAEDTNVDEPAEGPRRSAPAKPSDEEPPEFRESADNNISLPVDI
jgi:hypothetical protein